MLRRMTHRSVDYRVMSKTKIATITHVGRDVPDEIAFPLLIERLSRGKIVTDKGCWYSKHSTNGYGYCQIFFRGKRIYQHRVSYEAHIGPIPPGLYVLHTCDDRRCWNPEHLFLGTISDNKQDEIQKGRNYESNRTHCPRGHAYADFGVKQGKDKWRRCTICTRARWRLKAGWPAHKAYLVDPSATHS